MMATMLMQLPQAICRSVISIYHRYLSKSRPKCGKCHKSIAQSQQQPIADVTAAAAAPILPAVLPASSDGKWQITEEEQRKIDEVIKELDEVIQENDD